jgi:hypothetical protein
MELALGHLLEAADATCIANVEVLVRTVRPQLAVRPVPE